MADVRVTHNVTGVRSFAVAPDGQTFYAIVDEHPGPLPQRHISVVTGWFDEVRSLIGCGPGSR